MQTIRRPAIDVEGTGRARGAGFLWTAGLALALYWGSAIIGGSGGTFGLASLGAQSGTEVAGSQGHASWYGLPFHGRATASGERFDMNGLTAAHRTLPLGTRVRVRNLENGRSVVVRINDRGPYAANRAIDLSYGAARQLRMVKNGDAPVEITPVPTAP
jgi:rare lipoprotein A